MKSVSLIFVASAASFCRPRSVASLALPNLPSRSSARDRRRIGPIISRPGSSAPPRWPRDGGNELVERGARPMPRPLRLSKIVDDVEFQVEAEPMTTKTTTSSPPSDGSVESNAKVDETSGKFNFEKAGSSERTLGVLVLLTVPLAWGTYTPVVKYMYERMDPAVPGFVFSAGYYLVAASTLGLLSRMQGGGPKEEDVANEDGNEGDASSITARGGWELGSYLFVGNGLQVVGLQTVPADRAAFLVQLTTVMVPLLSALSEGTLSAVPPQTWFACIIAFVGVIIMGADDGGLGGSSVAVPAFDSVDLSELWRSLELSRGDVLIVLAALAYTMHVVRLGAYAPRTTPLKLAASKASTEAFLSVLLVAGLTLVGATHLPSPEFVGKMGGETLGYFRTIASALAGGSPKMESSTIGASIGAVVWTGWVTCAYTIYAQSFGQKRVNPTDSNLIYTTQPLFSSAFAYVLLGETLGFYGYVGATLIGTALCLVSFSERDSE